MIIQPQNITMMVVLASAAATLSPSKPRFMATRGGTNHLKWSKYRKDIFQQEKPVFSLLIHSYNNLCWVGDPRKRQNTHQARPLDGDEGHDVGNKDEESNQHMGGIRLLEACFYISIFLFGCGTSTGGCLWQSLSSACKWAEMRLLGKIFQISFWPRNCVLLPPVCWTLHVLGHSEGPKFCLDASLAASLRLSQTSLY